MGIHMPCAPFAVHPAIDAIRPRMDRRLDSDNNLEVTFGISRLAVRNGPSEISTQRSVSLAKLRCAMNALLKDLHSYLGQSTILLPQITYDHAFVRRVNIQTRP